MQTDGRPRKDGAQKPKRKARSLSCAQQPKQAHFLTLFLLWRLHRDPMHAYALAAEMRRNAPKPPHAMRLSTIYAILERLERSGLVSSQLEPSGGRARRIYQTTPRGWVEFEEMRLRRNQGIFREFLRALSR